MDEMTGCIQQTAGGVESDQQHFGVFGLGLLDCVLNNFDGDGVNYAVDGYGDNMMGGVLSGGWEAEE